MNATISPDYYPNKIKELEEENARLKRELQKYVFLYEQKEDLVDTTVSINKIIINQNKQMLEALKVAKADMDEYHQSIGYDEDCEPYNIVCDAIKAVEEE